MTDTATILPCGHGLRSVEEFDSLPVGTEIRLIPTAMAADPPPDAGTGISQRYTKQDDGQWCDHHNDGVARNPRHWFNKEGRNVIWTYPWMRVGHVIHNEAELMALPVGSRVVFHPTGYEWTERRVDGWYSTDREWVGESRKETFAGFNRGWRIAALPPDREGGWMRVGYVMRTMGEINALPVGAVINFNVNNSTEIIERRAEGWWDLRPGYGLKDRFASLGIGWVIRALPDVLTPALSPPPEGLWSSLAVGERVATREDATMLPVGAVIRYGTSDTYYKNGTDSWDNQRDSTRRRWGNDSFGDPRYEVIELPEGVQMIPRPEGNKSLAAFKAKFFAAAMGQARRSGINREPVERVLRNLGVPEQIIPGIDVAEHDISQLYDWVPDGTVVYCGSPEFPHTHGVFKWSRAHGGWVRLLGTKPNPGRSRVWVEQVPGTEPPPDVDETAQIIAFKAEAWRQGLRAKSDNSWCSDFETAMAAVGIDSTCVTAVNVVTGTMLDDSEIAALPMGSLVRWVGSETQPGRWAMAYRSGSVGNTAGVRRLMGRSEPGGSSLGNYRRNRMWPVFRPSDGSLRSQRVRVERFAEMEEAPLGTRICARSDSSESAFWEKEGQQAWRYYPSLGSASGTVVTPSQFCTGNDASQWETSPQYVYVSIPTPEGGRIE